MKQGKTLTDLAAEIVRQAQSKRDFIADSRRLTMTEDATKIAIPVNAHRVEMPLTELAESHLATRMEIPRQFYVRLRDKTPDVLAMLVNQLFEKTPINAMVRTLDGRVRAIMSNSYRPLDNADLAEAVLPVIQQRGANVESCEITETRLYIKVALPDLVAELPVPAGFKMGEGHHFFVRKVTAGLTISNSEVGCGSIAIDPGVFEKQCTNYARFEDASYRRVHIGGRKDAGDDGISEFFSDNTKRLNDAAVWSKVRDLAVATMDGRVFQKIVRQLTEARQDALTGDVPNVIEVFGEAYQLNEAERHGVLRYLTEGGELTRYGLQAAVTRMSQDVDDYDRASELERLGGKVIELPRNDWHKLLASAEKLEEARKKEAA